MRLFGDDPAATVRAQKNLIAWNARYAAAMLRPAAVMLVPMLVLVVALDGVFGRRPLRPGETAVITVQMRGEPNAVLAVPAGFAVETPPVRIPERSQICWRVRARAAAKGELRITTGEASAGRTIDGRPGLRFLAPAWLGPAKPGGISIEVEYPAASLSVLGLALWWPIPFAVICLAAMLALRNWFYVTF